MDDLQTPIIDTLRREIEASRSIASILVDYQNAQGSLVAENEKLKELVTSLSERVDAVTKYDGDVAHLIDKLKDKVLDLEISLTSSESELEAVKNRLTHVEGERLTFSLANTNLHQVVMNHESTIRTLKRDLAEATSEKRTA